MDVTTPRASIEGLVPPSPRYQAANIACAIALAEDYLGRVARRRLRAASSMLACPTPGRFDVVRADPLVLIDACHNPQSVETFLTAVRAIEPERPEGPRCCAPRWPTRTARAWLGCWPEFPRVVVHADLELRALPAGELAALFGEAGADVVAGLPHGGGGRCGPRRTVPFVACGSITLAGEVAGILRG